jgi:hypothetical protein
MTLNDYREWYKSEYGTYPGFKCIETFKKLCGVPEPVEPVTEEFWQEEEPKLPKVILRVEENV